METLETKERFIELRAKGYSFDRIAKTLGKAKQTLIDWSKEYEEEIGNLKASEIESLNERYYLTHERKIKLLGKQLKKIKDELEQRDLSEVPTDKLMGLFIQYYGLLEEVKIEPRFKDSDEVFDSKEEKNILDSLTGNVRPTKELKVV